MVILTGNMTRFFDYFRGFQKKYKAVAVFGAETDTEDVTGNIIKTTAIPDYSTVKQKSIKYTGEITQIPPVYSAVHINGKRSYQLAREGIIPDIKPRKAFIHSFTIDSYEKGLLSFSVSCSSGTYIRSIARDLARDCGSSAYLNKLLRTDIGNFSIDNSISPEDFTPENILSPFEGIKMMGIKTAFIKEEYLPRIRYGQILDSGCFDEIPDNGFTAVFDSNRNFLAFLEKQEDNFKYQFVIPEKKQSA